MGSTLALSRSSRKKSAIRTSSASARAASVSRCGERSPRSIIERKETLIRARSLRSSCVMRAERDIRNWRILRPTSLTTLDWMVRSDALPLVRGLRTSTSAIFKDTASETQPSIV